MQWILERNIYKTPPVGNLMMLVSSEHEMSTISDLIPSSSDISNLVYEYNIGSGRHPSRIYTNNFVFTVFCTKTFQIFYSFELNNTN